jgi:hypothetical protein
MTMEQVQSALLWSAGLNYGVLLLWFALFAGARGWVRRVHGRWFTLSDERFDALHYGLMGAYKLGIFLLFLGPWAALRLAL